MNFDSVSYLAEMIFTTQKRSPNKTFPKQHAKDRIREIIKEQSQKKNQSIFYKCLNSDNDMGRKRGYSFKVPFTDLSE